MMTPRSSIIIRVERVQNKVEIVFKNRKAYTYENLPYEIMKGLWNSDSIGAYFINNIKNKYKGTYVGTYDENWRLQK